MLLTELIPDELVRSAIIEWLDTTRKNGRMGAMYEVFCEELAPLAVHVARRQVLAQLAREASDIEYKSALADFLAGTLDGIKRARELTADGATVESNQLFAKLDAQLRKWIHIVGSRPTQPEATVHPSTDHILHHGGTP